DGIHASRTPAGPPTRASPDAGPTGLIALPVQRAGSRREGRNRPRQPASSASTAASSVLERISSLVQALLRWYSTVLWLRKSAAAASRVVRPPASRRHTWYAWGGSSPEPAAPR